MPVVDVLHVFPGEHCWEVWRDGEAQPLAGFPTRAEAVDWCREQAREAEHAQLLVHDPGLEEVDELVIGEQPHLPD